MRRFGLPAFARRWAVVPANPTIEVGGEVASPASLAAADLAELERVVQTSDLHCVTTWSVGGLGWGGYRMADVYECLIAPRARPDPGACFLLLRGLDGYHAALALEDALAPDVLIADSLDDQPLSLEHGAPLRVVAPAHYGYKSVKHLCAIELCHSFPPALPLGREHPRARVALEERGAGLPGRLLRVVYRPLVPPGRWLYRRAEARRPKTAG